MTKKPKVLIISQALAPAVGGSPILMNNLFSAFTGEVKAISGYPGERIDINFKPAFPIIYFNPPTIPLFGKYLKRYHDFLLRSIHPILIRHMVREINKYKPDVVFSHCPDIDYFICAYQAAILCKIPFYSHMHDLWEENHGPDTYLGKMALKWEAKILKNSKRVLCMTETQKLHYKTKYNIDADILPHTVPDEILDKINPSFKEQKRNELLFTGTVSKVMNLDALKVLAETTRSLQNEINITLCTSTQHSDFERLGIDSSNWDIKWMSREEVQKLQQQVSILFAPLSHKNCGIDEVKTVLSTKLLEYLISGRPILIFAPKDSFHAVSASKGGWALVVDVDDSKVLAQEIKRLLNDIDLQKRLVANAFKEAQNRRASVFAKKLYQWVILDSKN
jgi:glycosyltransferase involved in cell wall biosynthesis